MNINIIAGKNNEMNNEYIFSLLKSRDKNKKHIIIAPDRSLFSIERRLFDETNESCFFDISVTSISKLSKSLLINENKNILTKQSGVALVKKLLNDNKDKLTVFKKSINYMGFASSLFETICLYKSCCLSVEDIYVDDSSNQSNLKQKDIRLIYGEYEKYLQNEFTDSFNQLTLFSKLIDREFCKDTIFYFIEFDDYTALIYSIIEKLAKFSDSFYISASYGKGNNNSNIFTNKIYYDLISLFKANGLQYNINHVSSSDEFVNFLSNNLLSYNSSERYDENEKIEINSFDNNIDEIKYTIAKIYQKVLNNKSLTFSDFAIVLPNLNDYETLLKRQLKKYNIPYFVDKNDILIDHVFIRNLFDICNIIRGEFVLSDFTNLIKSNLLNYDRNAINDFDNILKSRGVRGYECLNESLTENEDLKTFINLINDLRLKIKKESKWQYYLQIIIEIHNYLLLRNENYVNSLNPLESRIYNQVMNKFHSINDDFLSVFSLEISDFGNFLESYRSYFETTNISLPPITSNTLFIADFNSSYLSTYPYIYLFGCNEGIMPKFKLDNGLVSDEEIARMPNANKINPTIKMLNARKTFKLFEIVFKSKKNLTLSFLNTNAKGKLYPNSLVLSLVKLLNIEIKNCSVILDQIGNSYYELNRENIVFNNLTKDVAKSNVLSLVKNWETYNNIPSYRLLISSLASSNDRDIYELIDRSKINKTIIHLDNCNMFKDNITSVSQIESYYNCPYMHYARYGLRLNKKKEYQLQPNDIGTIIHEVLKLLMPQIIAGKAEEEIISQSKEYLIRLLNQENYIHISKNPTNAYIIKSLYEELDRVCRMIKYEIDNSSFKPSIKHLEYSFNQNILVINDVKIRGMIDRVDMYGDDFIIIDYKTGDNHFENYNDVFSGKKLQLLVYAYAFQKENNKNLKGVYYFPLSNGFTKDTISQYRFNGVTYKSKENIIAIDNNLANPECKSKILNLTTGKNGDFYKNNYYDYLCIEKDDFDYLINFAIKQVKRAIDNIKIGNITPSPLKNGNKKTCKYCDFKGLCGYLQNNDNIVVKISSIEELKEKEGDNGSETE